MCDKTYDSCHQLCGRYRFNAQIHLLNAKNTKLYHLQTSNVMKEATFKNSAASLMAHRQKFTLKNTWDRTQRKDELRFTGSELRKK